MNSTTLPFNKSEYNQKYRLSLHTFDPKFEENLKEKPPVIPKAIQNRYLKDIIQNLRQMGFNTCSLQNAQFNDSKVFSHCFMYAYNVIDESHKFSKRWDDDFIKILKFLKYPFHLQRSDLYELSNGRSWSLTLNALHWVICTAMYFKNFSLELFYFEPFNPATASIAKCKWNFIFNSIHPEHKENAIIELNDELKKMELNFISSDIDINALETSVKNQKIQLLELEKFKSENAKLDEKISSLKSQIKKIEECSTSMINLINIFSEKTSKLNNELNSEISHNVKIKNNLAETMSVIKNQAIDIASVNNLNNQMQLSKRRINELVDNIEFVKDEQIQIETETREINFKIEDLLSSLLKQINLIRSEISTCGVNLNVPFPIEFSTTEWRQEVTSFKFKDFINEIKKSLNDNLKEIFSEKSYFEKENCEKNLDMIGLNDHKLDLIRKVSEIDNHYKISEKNARDMMSDAVSNNEDSILKLSHDKWNIKKTIEDNKYDTMNLESKLKKKRQIYEEINSDLTNQTNNTIYNLSSIINKLQTQLDKKAINATLLQQEIEEYCAYYES